MIERLLTRLIQLVLLAAIQIFICNQIHLFGYATPLIYVAFLLYFPLDSSRSGILVWSFLMGLLMDIFNNTPGIAAASMTFAGLLQPGLLRLMFPKDTPEEIPPSYHVMGTGNHIKFATLLVLSYCIVFFGLESFSFYDAKELLITMMSSMLLTLFVVLTTEMFRGRKA